MSEHEARAMAVKMLSEGKIKALHAVEKRLGRILVPYEIAHHFTDAFSVRKHWGIPDSPIYQEQHAERIRGEVTRLIREKKCSVNLGDEESRCNFDWHVFHSDIDFSYQAARRSAAESVQTPEEVFG